MVKKYFLQWRYFTDHFGEDSPSMIDGMPRVVKFAKLIIISYGKQFLLLCITTGRLQTNIL